MRRFFLGLMIVLLPLRGWMGDAMATEMAVPASMALTAPMQLSAEVTAHESHAHQPGTASHSHAGTEQVAGVFAAPGCADHAGSGHSPSDNSHCKSCVVCQACTVVGLAFPRTISAELHATPEKSPCTVSSFSSADCALSLKPPIS